MKSKDLRSLLLKLNNYLIRSLDTATGRGIKRGHYEITMEHLLLTLLDEGSGDVPLIFSHYGVEVGRVMEVCTTNIEEMKTGNPGKPKLSPLLTDLFQEAWMVSSLHHKEEKIRTGALLDVFVGSELIVSIGLWESLKSVFQEDLRANFHSIVSESSENVSSSGEQIPQEVARAIPKDGTVLDQFTVNFTQQARDGKIDPILGRDDEIIQMIEVLSRRKKSNPIVLGEPGVGKTAVVEGLAMKIAAEEVPDTLKGVQIHALDLGALQAGTKMRGEFEKRLKAVISEVMSSPVPIILFIDEAHTLIGAGNSSGGSDAANLLKPALGAWRTAGRGCDDLPRITISTSPKTPRSNGVFSRSILVSRKTIKPCSCCGASRINTSSIMASTLPKKRSKPLLNCLAGTLPAGSCRIRPWTYWIPRRHG